LALGGFAFFLGALVSLATSWVFVSRLERVGERFGLSEALLGVVAALAADAPEITAATSALAQNQKEIGAGVVIGSNVFNVAALLGLGALVAGFVSLHRRVVMLGGAVSTWVALTCLITVGGVVPAWAGLALALAAVLPYFIVLGLRRSTFDRLPLPKRWLAWISTSVNEEELELASAIRPSRGRPVDAVLAAGALVIVVIASIFMERGATEIGHHLHIADAVIGGVILAAVTSLPNAVAAVHLASKGRGAAALSTTLNSNNLNTVVGLLIPATILGLLAPSGPGLLAASWYVGLTILALVLAFALRGLNRYAGGFIIAGYVGFVGVLVVIT
jgi:cation:H+ antiporter